MEPIAHARGNVGCERTWVVHGYDGTDELTTAGKSYVASLENGKVDTFEISPGDAGLPEVSLEDLKGGDAEYNAVAIRKMLEGELGPYRDVVLLNTAALQMRSIWESKYPLITDPCSISGFNISGSVMHSHSKRMFIS